MQERGPRYNGGFGQYFTNSSGDYYYETEDSLAALEFGECLDLLRQAKQVFVWPGEWVDRRARTQAARAALQALANARPHLDELNNRFLEAFKNLQAAQGEEESVNEPPTGWR